MTHVQTTDADLGFYRGECPIHLKGALEVECRREMGSGEGAVPPPSRLGLAIVPLCTMAPPSKNKKKFPELLSELPYYYYNHFTAL